MSIKHLSDLPTAVIREVFGMPWEVSEKFDGSYIRAGFDDDGRYYTNRKGPNRYYSLSDWPDMAWTDYFRSAHAALESYMEAMMDRGLVAPGNFIDVEIINGRRPNSIYYPFSMGNSLMIVNGNWDYDTPHAHLTTTPIRVPDGSITFVGFSSVTVHSKFHISLTGSAIEVRDKSVAWNINTVITTSFDPIKLDEFAPTSVLSYLDSKTKLYESTITREDAINLKLNRKPDCIPDVVWKHERLFVLDEIRRLRTESKADLQRIINMLAPILFNATALEYFGPRTESEIEGVVCKAGPHIFKIVNRETFPKLNNFTHIVRYWLQGGRRPNRPSFVSRTEHWPVEKRLARLDVLRMRYLKHRFNLRMDHHHTNVMYGANELNSRTLVLFAELKERIKNGRGRIQGKDSQNSDVGDRGDDSLAIVEDGN